MHTKSLGAATTGHVERTPSEWSLSPRWQSQPPQQECIRLGMKFDLPAAPCPPQQEYTGLGVKLDLAHSASSPTGVRGPGDEIRRGLSLRGELPKNNLGTNIGAKSAWSGSILGDLGRWQHRVNSLKNHGGNHLGQAHFWRPVQIRHNITSE